jgi:very-short-patch-repair endonuclease
MRHEPTDAERSLWTLLRGRRFVGYKFRRQVPIGSYIVDVMCPDARLIVELDGSQHAESDYDAVRDEWLRARGYRVLRIWNNELNGNRNGVLEAIWNALQAKEWEIKR